MMTGAGFRTDYRLWAVTAASLFITLGFVDSLAGSGVKENESLWHQAGILARGDYICTTSDLLLHVLFLASLLLVPAVLLGWLLQAVVVVVRERRSARGG